MTQKIFVRDLTLCDAQQSTFATRMTQEQINHVLPYYRNAGFYAMEVWGGAVPDTMMRFLGENPWNRLDQIKAEIGNMSRLSAVSSGRNLVGYSPYPDTLIESFYRNVIESGIDLMRVFDPLNDIENLKSSIRYIKRSKAKVDGAICYEVDAHYSPVDRIKAALHGEKIPGSIYTDAYFLEKALQLEAAGANIITIEDMSGLMTPSRTASIIQLFKQHLKVPVDFHTHCTPGYGLASVLMAILHGVDMVDTNIWYFAGGSASPALELVYVFCKKMGIELDLNMEAVAAINKELYTIRKELSAYDPVKEFPKPFNPLVDSFPAEIDRFFNEAIVAARHGKEDDLLRYCHAIEAYFNFPVPNEQVKVSQLPAGMYTHLVAQLKQVGEERLLEDALCLIPKVREDAGMPPLVTPISQIIAAQAVSCALDKVNNRPLYSNPSIQFIELIRGDYGKMPVAIDPLFRQKITGIQKEIAFDDANYIMQKPLVDEEGSLLAETEKELLLLELFPTTAKRFLIRQKEQRELSIEAVATEELIDYAE
ncbi:carboxylase [Parabacteroides sp. PF5-9]|uniref:carboxylase n=1 Tax=Parabacteroides sp. PF5-9 TaxID=1742404 RepID=UPI002476ABBA|nr:carboxylase [Parabacteroides sp. PF5-9]MDH6357529.1 pyruvate/oxaloacetate carboxyltransferase [Parabacteroides sp. PF5-9]